MEINFSRWSLATLFHYRAKVKHQVVRSHKISNPYHAVSISCGFPACEAAKQLQGQRFLSAEAPLLPVSTCDVYQCKCRYQHHTDRRAGDRRDNSTWSPNKREWKGAERRAGGGRRITDN